MPYAVLADIQALIAKFTIDGTSKPNATQAAIVIEGISAEIDSVISGAGYTVPVASPAWFLDYLQLLNAYGAAAALIRSIFADKTGSADGYEGGIEAYYAAQYNKGLQRLKNGDGLPAELLPTTGTVLPSTYFTRNPDTEEELGDIAEPSFTRSQVL